MVENYLEGFLSQIILRNSILNLWFRLDHHKLSCQPKLLRRSQQEIFIEFFLFSVKSRDNHTNKEVSDEERISNYEENEVKASVS